MPPKAETIVLPTISDPNPALFANIADDLYREGFSIQRQALPPELAVALLLHVQKKSEQEFTPAGIGREQLHHQDQTVRSDAIDWINGESAAGQQWLIWAEALKNYLNRRLFLGLFSFESHFALYQPGDFYKRHYDAFRGQANRILSVVVYLNEQWQADDGGELVLYRDEHDQEGLVVWPELGTVVTFLSEEFPHEVKPARRDRYSIACWFRVNGTGLDRVDPPR